MNKPRKQSRATRINDTVYVIGAGFSFDLGYPLTSGVLVNVWNRLEASHRERLERVIRFHHPNFDPGRESTYPDIERLLTEISVNEELFGATRRIEGNFKKSDLADIRQGLLLAIADWFHRLYPQASEAPWLQTFAQRIINEGAAVISFNWDLVLDHQLFENNLNRSSYGLGIVIRNTPRLLKPHGSLNWYEGREVQRVRADKRVRIFPAKDGSDEVNAFTYPRDITSKIGKRYSPLIVPPTFFKSFNKPIFVSLWQACTDVLSTAREVYVIGYSLPPADMQAQYILRCGFYNQLEGLPNSKGTGRATATGPANVYIINPDQAASRRIEAIAGPRVKCRWIAKRASEWILGSSTH